MFREQCCDRQNDFSANFNGYNDVNMDVDINVDNNMAMPAQGMDMPMNGGVASPIIAPVQERVVQMTIMQ